MDQIIQKAQKRLASLQIEAEQIRNFLEMYEKLAQEDAPAPDANSSDSAKPAALAGARVGKSTPAEIVAAAKELMREKQRPLTRTELVRLLTLRGVRIGGTDKSKNVGTIIWRSKEFENVEGKGYWPLELGPWGESEFNF